MNNHEITLGLVKQLAKREASKIAGTTIQSIEFDREENDIYYYNITLTNGTVVVLQVPVNTTFTDLYVVASGSTSETDPGNIRLRNVLEDGVNKLAVERREGTNWVRITTIGTLSSDEIILEGKGAKLLNNTGTKIVSLLKASSIDDGPVVGHADAGISLLTNGQLRHFHRSGDYQDVNIQSIDTDSLQILATTPLVIPFTTTQAQNDKSITVKFLDVSAGTTARMSLLDENDVELDWSDSQTAFDNGNGTPITNGSITFSPIQNSGFPLDNNTVFKVKIQVSANVNILGDNDADLNDGRGARFVPFLTINQAPLTFSAVMDSDNYKNFLDIELSEFFILDSGDNYMTTRIIKDIDELVGSHSSSFNVSNTENRVDSMRVFLDRVGAPQLEMSSFDTFTLNDGTLSTGTFSFTQAQIDRLKQGSGEVGVRVGFYKDGTPSALALRYAGNIDILNSEFAFAKDHTIFVNSETNEDEDGINRLSPFNTIAKALTKASEYPGGEHKQIICEEIHDFAVDVDVNVANIIFNTPGISLHHLDCASHTVTGELRKLRKLTVGPNCNLYVHSVGYGASDGIYFTSGYTHSRTHVKVNGVESPSLIRFTGATGRIHIEVEEYNSSIQDVIDSIPDDLIVTGYIADYVFEPYGGSYLLGTQNTVCAVADTDYKVDATFTMFPSLYFEWDSTNDRLKYTGKDKDFIIDIDWTASASAGCEMEYSLFKNGSLVTGISRSTDFQNVNDKNSLSLGGIVSLSSGDYLELYVSSDTNNVTASTEQVQLVLR